MSLAQKCAGGRAGGQPLSGDAPVYMGCHSTWLAERRVPAWKERTNGHRRPGLLADRGALSPSETLELQSFMSSFRWVIPLGLGAYVEATRSDSR